MFAQGNMKFVSSVEPDISFSSYRGSMHRVHPKKQILYFPAIVEYFVYFINKVQFYKKIHNSQGK